MANDALFVHEATREESTRGHVEEDRPRIVDDRIGDVVRLGRLEKQHLLGRETHRAVTFVDLFDPHRQERAADLERSIDRDLRRADLRTRRR